MSEVRLPPGMPTTWDVAAEALRAYHATDPSGAHQAIVRVVEADRERWAAHVAELEQRCEILDSACVKALNERDALRTRVAEMEESHAGLRRAFDTLNDAKRVLELKLAEARAEVCPWCHRTGRPCPSADYDAGQCQKPEGHEGRHYASTGSIAVNWGMAAPKETP